jgi:hypothetical protein
LPSPQKPLIGAQDICDQQRIAGIIAGSAGSKPAARAFDHFQVQHKNLTVPLILEKIEQDIVRCFQANLTGIDGQPQFFASFIDFPETGWCVWDN